MGEPFNIKKLFDLSPVGFYKVIGLSIKVGLVLLVVFGILWIKNLLFPAAGAVKDIHVSKGGKVIINEDKRRLEFFVGGFGSADKEGDTRLGAFGGVKF